MEALPPDLDLAIDEADLDAAVAAIDDDDLPAAEEAPVTYEMDMTARWGSKNAVLSGSQTSRPKPKVPTIPSNFKRRYAVRTWVLAACTVVGVSGGCGPTCVDTWPALVMIAE